MHNKPNDPTLILAPHLEFPTRNGGDIYIERLAHHLSKHRDIVLLAKNIKLFYRQGKSNTLTHFSNTFRPKLLAATRTILFRTHYLSERFLTTEYKKQAEKILQEYPLSTAILSLLSTNSIIKRNHRKLITLTQNDEIVWFGNQRKFTSNPFHKWVAWQSEVWVRSFFREQTKSIFLAHICQSDFDGYKKIAPQLTNIIVPAGVESYQLSNSMIYDGVLHLLFVGSLSVKMNQDALSFFSDAIWPQLKEAFGKKIKFSVAGSNPTNSVKNLVNKEQWTLFANLDDKELQELYTKATFAVLPFPYTTGAKLKLLNAMTHGLPVLGTKNMISLPNQEFSPNFYSDLPEDWVSHLAKFSPTGISFEEREKCQEFASQYSWQKIVEKFELQLNQLGL